MYLYNIIIRLMIKHKGERLKCLYCVDDGRLTITNAVIHSMNS